MAGNEEDRLLGRDLHVDGLIGLTGAEGVTFKIEVERANGKIETFTGLDLKWETDRRITFLDLANQHETTISAPYIKVVKLPARGPTLQGVAAPSVEAQK